MKCFGSNSFSRTPSSAYHPRSFIQIDPWAGLLPEQGLCPPGGSPSRGLISSRRVLRGVEFQVSPYSNQPVGGVPCSIAARPPTVGRVRHTAKGPHGLPLAPAWVVSRPHPTALSPMLSRFGAMSIGMAGPDEGGLKTHRLCSVGSEGVCGWLADGYHYPKTFGGQPESVSVGILLVASLHDRAPM